MVNETWSRREGEAQETEAGDEANRGDKNKDFGAQKKENRLMVLL
jgi:hypothetical protein